MLKTFTRRPVLSSVVSIVITLLGLIALARLPVTLFPDVAPPEVNVTVVYTGANAETVGKTTIVPLERMINGVPGMKYMASDMGNDGVGVVQVVFETGTDPDVAAINVQNRVNTVLDELPPEVLKRGVEVSKQEHSMLMFLTIDSTNPEHDEKFLFNLVDINVLPELKRIHGVGYADILGSKEYAMRIWLKPDKMVAYRVAPQDVLDALRESNVEAAPGKIGENSDRGNQSLQYTVKYTGKYKTPAEYANIPIRATAQGEILRIRDVADVELGAQEFDEETKLDGRPSAAIMLRQLPGSNASEVIAQIKELMARLKREQLPEGVNYHYSYDVSRFLNASIHEVVKTFFEAFLLVALVVFVFLQDWRSTLVPALAVPVSLVGTFFFIQFFGFSVNLITLFALVLAIGIVVDNAIVVVEAVHAKLAHTQLTVQHATDRAMEEIGGAIVAITLVMSAVFVPVGFIGGPSGVFYRQFSITMAIAIVLSGVVALTLTPALCALLLKPVKHGPSANPFFREFNRRYHRLEERYASGVSRAAARRVVTALVLVAFTAGTGLLGSILQTGFIPEEDQGTFYASITTPAGVTLERTKEVVDAIQELASDIPEIESISTLAGTDILTDGTRATSGTCVIDLKPWDERKRSVKEIMADLEARTHQIKGGMIEYFTPPPVPGYGDASGIEIRLLDKTGSGNIARQSEVVKQFVADLEARPEIASAFTVFNAGYPEYMVHVDIDKAAQKGVSVENALSAMQTVLGSEYATNFIRFGQMYRVMVQAAPEYRAEPEQMLRIQVRNDQQEMVPLADIVSLERTYGADQMTRYNMYPSAELHSQPAPGVSSGAAIAVIQQVAREKLPKGYGIDWAGATRDEVNAGNEGLIVFFICLIFVYLVLAAQYESFVLPMSVVLSLPPGIFGAFAGLRLAHLENNIYAHVALLMLIGLLGKNAILIVEFAELKRREGRTPFEAAVQAARLRLRPILMTSFAFLVGLLPLVVATGAGAVGNRTIGTAAAAGMLFGTVFGLVLVPGLYVVFASVGLRLSKRELDAIIHPAAPVAPQPAEAAPPGAS
ncbi:MAG: efflux RND transporter permease subunit [Archangiaceae bacterium]|nr:efflux RND transporter permease subunit [Archangiaceae bacterium]